MQPIILDVSKREAKLGRGKLNAMRKEGLLPGVIYGQEVEPISFIVQKKEFLKIIGEHGSNAILGVKVDNGKPIQAMVKDVQKHPVTGLYWHVDLGQISLNQVVRTTIPIVFEGEPQGVSQGGFIQYGDTNVEVECLPMELPQNISLDISQLEIGDKVVVGDLKLSGDITILGEPEQVIVSIVQSTVEEKVDEPEETLGEDDKVPDVNGETEKEE